MFSILSQILLIIILFLIIRDIIIHRTYPRWGIIIYLIVLFLEEKQFHSLLQYPGNETLKFLYGVSLFLLGSLLWCLIKFFRRVKDDEQVS